MGVVQEIMKNMGICEVEFDNVNIGKTLSKEGVKIVIKQTREEITVDNTTEIQEEIIKGQKVTADAEVLYSNEAVQLFPHEGKIEGKIKFISVKNPDFTVTLPRAKIEVEYMLNYKKNRYHSISLKVEAYRDDFGDMVLISGTAGGTEESKGFTQIGYPNGGLLEGKLNLDENFYYLASDGFNYLNIGGYRSWEGSGTPDDLFVQASFKTLYTEWENMKYSTYDFLSDIGLVDGDLTAGDEQASFKKIIEAMPNSSILITDVNDDYPNLKSIMPKDKGLLEITKRNANRVVLKFTQIEIEEAGRIWESTYTEELLEAVRFGGWIPSNEALRSLESIGLTDGDLTNGNGDASFKTIVEAMDQGTTLKIHNQSTSNNLSSILPGTYKIGFLEINKGEYDHEADLHFTENAGVLWHSVYSNRAATPYFKGWKKIGGDFEYIPFVVESGFSGLGSTSIIKKGGTYVFTANMMTNLGDLLALKMFQLSNTADYPKHNVYTTFSSYGTDGDENIMGRLVLNTSGAAEISIFNKTTSLSRSYYLHLSWVN